MNDIEKKEQNNNKVNLGDKQNKLFEKNHNKTLLKRVLKFLWNTFLICFISLTLFEISYRYQWIDFYKAEFNALNSDSSKKDKNVLIFGDSFSAQSKSYVDELRKNHPETNFVNAAIPGTGPIEVSYILQDKIETYHPSMIIYQLYIGNDFTDIKPPVNWNTNSFSRNVYYTLKPYYTCLSYISRKFNGLQHDFDPNDRNMDSIPFDADLYSKRTKLLVKAAPNYINNTLNVNAEYKNAFNKTKEVIERMRKLAPKECRIYILVIPHFSQVSSLNNENYRKLGATSTDQKTQYPLVEYLTSIKGVQILNPLDFFKTANKINDLYYQNDPHLTNFGQEQLTTFIEQKIRLSE